MIKYCLKKWEKNKDKLETAIRADKTINNEELEYDYLVKLVVDYILNDEENQKDCQTWDSDRISRVDSGEWQGTLLYLIPTKDYQPAEYQYLMTFVDYGSCAGCDTLQYIRGENNWEEGLPTEQQVKDYMTLCRDLVSNMIRPYNTGWRHQEEFDIVEEKESEERL